ncbi:YcfA-like protein [archaeon BMS3Bbin16]|nr:YcfA-like protein [archaeon BMS3Bbin16]
MKLPAVSGEKVIKALGKAGFVYIRQKGSHIRLEKTVDDEIIKVTVPLHKTLKKGTLKRIIKDSRLSQDELIDLL